jgi:hypothetical protein
MAAAPAPGPSLPKLPPKIYVSLVGGIDQALLQFRNEGNEPPGSVRGNRRGSGRRWTWPDHTKHLPPWHRTR